MRRIIQSIIIVIFSVIVIGCNLKNNYVVEQKSDNKETNSMRAIINKKEYEIILENNDTTNRFLDLLPLELNMKELNGNEKYIYLDFSLPTNPINPKEINIGDIMLYGDNCLVVFYKSFNTSYSYTKIGHINALPELGNDSLLIRFEK